MHAHRGIARPATMPKVSVIIPAYNAEPYLREAIESVRRQTHRNLEIIVVDDGSSDGTARIAATFHDVVYVHQHNRGASSARNSGARLARGKYLAFLDADDVWHPCKLEHQLRALSEHPESVFCHTLLSRDPDSVKGVSSPALHYVLRPDLSATFLDPYLCPSSVMVLREAFESVGGFDESLPIAEDIDFFLRVLVHSPVVLTVDRPMVFFRPVPGSLSSDTTAGYIALQRVYRRFLASHPGVVQSLGPGLVSDVFYRLQIKLAMSRSWDGNRRQARREALVALRYRISLYPIILFLRMLIPDAVLSHSKRLRLRVFGR